MAADMEYMQPEDIAQHIKSYQLEQKYQQRLRETERIYEEERVRVLRVQMILLEDENDELRDQLGENGNELDRLEDTNDELRQRMADAEEELQQVQVELKARLRDAEHYRREVEALNAASSDSSKVYSEKLALSRELSTLKPELEHLKSHATTQQNLLAEKLALQRELSTIQVELETEKRAVQRMKSNEKTVTHDDSPLQDEIDNLKKELAKAKRDSQKVEKDNMKKSTEWESQKEGLENKLDAFRNKLRTTKEELKEAREEVERLQAAKMAQSAELTKARLAGKQSAAANPRKRNVARFDPDMTIGTPGTGGPAAKKQRSSVNVGDKSTFSITPFLNRTMSILPESPSGMEVDSEKTNKEMNKAIDEVLDENDAAEKLEKQKEKKVASKPTAGPAKKAPSATAASSSKVKTTQAQPLKESTKSKANAVVKKPSLPKVTEDPEDEDQENQSRPSPSHNTSKEGSAAHTEPAKKKRPNIFDDDNAAAPVDKPKIKSLKSLNSSGLGNVSLLGLGAGAKKTKKTLAEFSPLKKDRKAATAGA